MCNVRHADFILHNDIKFIISIFIYDKVCWMLNAEAKAQELTVQTQICMFFWSL